VDYLLKPVEADRLTRTLRTLRGRHGRADVTRLLETVAPAPPLRRLVGRHLRTWHVLPVDEIEAFVVDDGLVFAVTARGRFLVDRTLRGLQATLSPERFVRVHKRAIVNLDTLIAIDPIVRGGGNARLTSGQVIPISRRCAATLRARLQAAAVDPVRRRARRDTQVP
jgi:DNA-binding LytR/AlgR family response regulator